MSRETSSAKRDRSSTIEKAAFVLSVAALAFLYGVATQAFGWPPSELLTRAWRQFRTVAGLVPDEKRFGFLVPRIHERAGARTTRQDDAQPGLTLIASYWEDLDWKPGLKLIDADGRTVHEWRVDPPAIFPESADRMPEETVRLVHRHVHGFHLEPNGELLLNVEYVGTVRMDACGNVLWRLARGNHHSVEKADDGSFWIPGNERVDTTAEGRARRERYPGLDAVVREDRILRVSADGEVLEDHGLFDVLYSNDLERHVARGVPENPDITHLNDLQPLDPALADEYPLFEAGDLAISIRHLHLVAVLDPDTGEVKWSRSWPFVGQHDPEFLGDGWIGVFDNQADGTRRGEMLGGSRVVAVRPGTDSTRVLFPTRRSDPLHTAYMGEWQPLENGNLLLVESVGGRVAEVDPEGRTVWEWVVEPFDEEFVPWVTGAKRYAITAEDVEEWTCRDGAAAEPTR